MSSTSSMAAPVAGCSIAAKNVDPHVSAECAMASYLLTVDCNAAATYRRFFYDAYEFGPWGAACVLPP